MHLPVGIRKWLGQLPSQVFEKSGVRKYSAVDRAACYFVKGLEYSLAGLFCGLAGQVCGLVAGRLLVRMLHAMLRQVARQQVARWLWYRLWHWQACTSG